MEFKANFAKIVGLSSQEGTDSWVYVEDGLFLVLEISAVSDFPSSLRGKEIVDQLAIDFRQLSVKNLANIETLVKKIQIDESANLSLVLGAQIGRGFYLICRGVGRAVIKRQDKFGIILSEDGSASGILEDKDIVLLTSPRFSEIVSFDEVKNCLETSTPLKAADLAESLTSLVHRSEDTSGVAALILQFEEINSQWVEEKNPEQEEPSFSGRPDLKFKILSILQRSKAIYLRQPLSEEEKKKRIIFGIAVILAILLIISIVLGFSKRPASQKQSRFQQPRPEMAEFSVKRYNGFL